MEDSAKLDCPYCDKKYVRGGFLPSHISKKHEYAVQLDQNMTVLRDNAADLSTQEAGANLFDNTFVENPEMTNIPRLQPTPVPLCLTAKNYIVEKGKTLPASFLATLLPAPGFIEQLDKSLQEENDVTDLMERFENEIRCSRCHFCEFTCLGTDKLKEHIENNHSSPDLPSLGDYLACLENKIDKCNELITRQSVITSRQSVMIEKLLKLQEEKMSESIVTTRAIIKCNECVFEAVDRTSLNNHKDVYHNKIQTLIICPMCSYSNTSEHSVTKHVEDEHKEKYTCPMCSYSNTSVHNVNKHVQDQHKERYACNKCDKEFSSHDTLKSHIKEVHEKTIHSTPRRRPVTLVDIEEPEVEKRTEPTPAWTLLVGDSHVKSVKARAVEKALNQKENRLRNPAFAKPKEGSAYTTTRHWPNAKYPENNLEDMLPKLLKERPYKNAIVLTPSNNITNVKEMPKEEQNQLAVHTALETLNIVEKALEEFPNLEKAVIVELPPRADNQRLSELVEFANFVLKSSVANSKYRNQISIASLEPLYDQSEYAIFGSSSSPKSDGIHMRGNRGRRLYTDCILNAIKSADLCSSVTPTVAASYSIPTSNMFDLLSN